MTVSTPRAHERAKAMAVSDNRATWPTGPGCDARGQYPLQTSSNRSNLKPLVRTPVTNVVNLRPKTTIFSEKAVGLTTFVTTHSGAPQDPSTTSQTTFGVRRTRLQRPWAAAGPGRASSRRTQPHISDQAPPVWRAPEGPGPGCDARGLRRVLVGLQANAQN